ncbi:hypothetical protein EJB05_16057 [Eragrostis curvula]|uniref:Uncharacterized protein n=1 Tax=Eragrostis curvula TaxID=38414 RepID=A0A5J9VE14_9POAL|nr:hypothetical protein EJB05_16057 [Eragrostis curvula]
MLLRDDRAPKRQLTKAVQMEETSDGTFFKSTVADQVRGRGAHDAGTDGGSGNIAPNFFIHLSYGNCDLNALGA